MDDPVLNRLASALADVMPDGAHFIFLEPDNAGELVMVANWRSVLRARMASRAAR